MRFRTVVVAAVILMVVSVAALAAFTIAEDARNEAAQTQIDRTDELLVEQGLEQKLVSDDDHHPTSYDDSITVTYDDQTWTEGEEYEYSQDNGTITFLVDEDGSATIEYGYEIPEDQVTDDQMQTLTIGYSNVAILAGGLALVVVFLFIGGFVAKRLGIGSSNTFRSNR